MDQPPMTWLKGSVHLLIVRRGGNVTNRRCAQYGQLGGWNVLPNELFGNNFFVS